MARADSPYVVGDYWLDKRRDGKSPDIWQIASGTRQVKYRTTGQRSLDDAKPVIHAYVEAERAKRPQQTEDALVIPLLLAYWKEKGWNAVSPAQIASSLRAFMGFLFQDELGMNAVASDLTPAAFERFRAWRMAPHEYDVPWGGKDYRRQLKAVRGESVQRNLDDVRAALNYAGDNRRLPWVPKVPALEKRYRSPPKDRVMTMQELGKVAFYARHFDDMGRYVALMLATLVRPEAAGLCQPSQYDDRTGLIDLHPAAKVRTDKRNPIIPAIRPLRLIMRRWRDNPTAPVKSRGRAWRTMRRVMGLPSDIDAKTIRHTLATMLYSMPDVPERQISDLLGHGGNLHRTSRVYAKYRPDHMAEIARALSTIWLAVSREARKIAAVQVLSIPRSEGGIILDKIVLKTLDNRAFDDGGR